MDRRASRPLDPAAAREFWSWIAAPKPRPIACSPRIRTMLTPFTPGALPAPCSASTWAWAKRPGSAGLRAAIAARRDHERVLELDPDYVDAKMVVGVHNYVIGSLSWPVRVSASIVGIGGNKKKGLNMLRQLANAGSLASPDAKIALALFLRREQAYDEALRLVQGMSAAYPRSCMIALEYAASACGRGPRAGIDCRLPPDPD